MIRNTLYDKDNKPSAREKKAMAAFLHEHMEEFRDNKDDIAKAIDYAVCDTPSPGGFVLMTSQESTMAGVAVVTKTGMTGFVPENLLVYIATHKEHRGSGIGKNMMQLILCKAEGNLALHVEPHNLAKNWYEKLGFTNKYVELRYIRQND